LPPPSGNTYKGSGNDTYRVCSDNKAKQQDYDYSECMSYAEKHVEKFVEKPNWKRSLGLALFPIPFAWIVAYLMVLIVRWIRAGFVNSP
jgi:hypothetical protein